MSDFAAQVFQNEYLPAGGEVVDAVVTVTAAEGASAGRPNEMVEVIVIDTSGSMQGDRGAKIASARDATKVAIDTLRDGVLFAIVAGTELAQVVYPFGQPLARADERTRTEAKAAVSRVEAKGGTAIGSWLKAASSLIAAAPGAISHVVLMTDGKNEHERPHELDEAIAGSVGQFQCDCLGLGTDWIKAELDKVSSALLGRTDIVPTPGEMEFQFRALTEKAMGKQTGNVALRLWTPQGSQIEFLKQVAPELDDLTPKAQTVSPLVRDYPLGAWAGGEDRDYHLQVRVPVGSVGSERLAARVMLVVGGVEQPAALVRALWTDDERLSTRINREVAHYTGQAELADAIHDGLAARDSGDDETATVKLGRAVQLAHETGNDETVRLLQKVVDVEDPDAGTVRLKREVADVDAMTLDVRSTRTVRVNKSQ